MGDNLFPTFAQAREEATTRWWSALQANLGEIRQGWRMSGNLVNPRKRHAKLAALKRRLKSVRSQARNHPFEAVFMEHYVQYRDYLDALLQEST